MIPDYHEFETEKLNKISAILSRKGIISRINFDTWTADVQVLGGTQGVMKSVPMSTAVSKNVQIGDRCVLDVFDETNPTDMIVAYTYGRSPTKAASGSLSLSLTCDGFGFAQGSIPHGLGATPSFVSVSGHSYTYIIDSFPIGSYTGLFIDTTQGVNGADDTYIYVAAYMGSAINATHAYTTYWAAVIL